MMVMAILPERAFNLVVPLDTTATRDYLSPVTEKNVIGIGSPEWSGDEPHSASNAAFLSPWHPQFWAAGREEPQQGSPVLHRYFRLPFGLPSQSEVGMAVTYCKWSNAMEKHIAVDRETASRLNPFISSGWTEDTLHSMAAVVYELGYMISETELAHGHMFNVFGAIAAALEWEVDNIDSCRLARAKKEASHG
jgi:hypothetical protein